MPAKTGFIFLMLFLLTACAAPVADLPPTVASATNPPVAQPETQPEASAEETAAPEATVAQAMPAPEPTSRGDALVATDPALLNLENGRPQLVEFFRFT